MSAVTPEGDLPIAPPPIIHPARSLLDKFNRDHPGIWRLVADARAKRDWPEQVYLPQSCAGEIQKRVNLKYGRLLRAPHLTYAAMLLSMLSAWRSTQGIYQFDDLIRSELLESEFTGEIPVEALTHQPEWCVYIETPGRSWSLNGCTHHHQGLWAWLDWQPQAETHLQLAIALHLTGHQLAFVHLPLVAGGTVEEAFLQVGLMTHGGIRAPAGGLQPTPELQRQVLQNAQVVSPLLSLLLFLYSDPGEIGDGKRLPQRPEPRKSKGREIVSPPDRPVRWPVAVRMGTTLRLALERRAADEAADQTAGPQHVRPHVRRAHWAHRWIGPKSGERKLVLRWIHPSLVNARSPDDLPSVIRPVTAGTQPQRPTNPG